MLHSHIDVAQTRMLVQSQALITQLVFNHALRVRMKAEVTNSSSSATSTAATTPDSASIAPSERADSPDGSEEDTAFSETTSATKASKGKHSKTASTSGQSSKAPEQPADGSQSSGDSKAGNFVGKLNNLVTTDLNNLIDGRDFLFVGEFTHIALKRPGLDFGQFCTYLSRSHYVSGSYTLSLVGGLSSCPLRSFRILSISIQCVGRIGCDYRTVPNPWIHRQARPGCSKGEDEKGIYH